MKFELEYLNELRDSLISTKSKVIVIFTFKSSNHEHCWYEKLDLLRVFVIISDGLVYDCGSRRDRNGLWNKVPSPTSTYHYILLAFKNDICKIPFTFILNKVSSPKHQNGRNSSKTVIWKILLHVLKKKLYFNFFVFHYIILKIIIK